MRLTELHPVQAEKIGSWVKIYYPDFKFTFMVKIKKAFSIVPTESFENRFWAMNAAAAVMECRNGIDLNQIGGVDLEKFLREAVAPLDAFIYLFRSCKSYDQFVRLAEEQGVIENNQKTDRDSW